jgi:hypothetical protein
MSKMFNIGQELDTRARYQRLIELGLAREVGYATFWKEVQRFTYIRICRNISVELILSYESQKNI